MIITVLIAAAIAPAIIVFISTISSIGTAVGDEGLFCESGGFLSPGGHNMKRFWFLTAEKTQMGLISLQNIYANGFCVGKHARQMFDIFVDT